MLQVSEDFVKVNKLNLSDKVLTDSFLELGEKDRSIILFLYENGKPLPAGDIARSLNLPHSTVNSAIKRLEKKGYVDWKEYYFVQLNQVASKMAAHHFRHHVTIHHYFVKFLNMDDGEAHIEGHRVAGVLSCNTVKKMKDKLVNCDLQPCYVYTERAQ